MGQPKANETIAAKNHRIVELEAALTKKRAVIADLEECRRFEKVTERELIAALTEVHAVCVSARLFTTVSSYVVRNSIEVPVSDAIAEWARRQGPRVVES
jgi:hypothetical protein